MAWWMLPLAGFAIGAYSAKKQSEREQEALRQQKEMALEQYRLGKEYSDRQYALNRS